MRHPGRNGHRRAAGLLMVALAVIVAACGADRAERTTAPAATATIAPTPTALVITPLEGTWSTTFTAIDVSPIGSHFGPGTWLLIIHGESSTLYKPEGTVMDISTLELAGPDEIVVPAEPSCIVQAQPTTGIYTFRITGDRLVFTKVQDSCVNRAFQFTAHPWTKRS